MSSPAFVAPFLHSTPVRRAACVRACISTPPPAAVTARVGLLDALSNGADVDTALRTLLSAAPNTSTTVGWESTVDGRWALRYTTEPPLADILERGLFPFGNAARSYQLFRVGGVVENVIEFANNRALRVEARYVPRGTVRGFDFDFQRTRIMYGAIDITLPFAVGSGYVELAWLDQALRVDRSMLGGREVLNVYVYEGPVERCTAGAT